MAWASRPAYPSTAVYSSEKPRNPAGIRRSLRLLTVSDSTTAPAGNAWRRCARSCARAPCASIRTVASATAISSTTVSIPERRQEAQDIARSAREDRDAHQLNLRPRLEQLVDPE